jgi:hypothetical protein
MSHKRIHKKGEKKKWGKGEESWSERGEGMRAKEREDKMGTDTFSTPPA